MNYSSLWASCDKLRGGMDASQYKDYILTLLFVKYVTDKCKGVKYADITVPEGGSFDDLVKLKGNKNIGEEMDKVISKLAKAENNNLVGVITNARINDESKLGKGQEMVDKLTGLIAIFQRHEFDFKNNKAVGDDIVKELPIQYPKDVAEQNASASILSDMDKEIEALEQKLAKTRQIKQGMMQQLLTEKIRLV